MSLLIAPYAGSGSGNARLAQRLWLFIAASITLHALMLAYTPGGSGGTTLELRSGAPLHAVLAPLPAPRDAAAETLHTPPQDAAPGRATAPVTDAAPLESTPPRAGAPGLDLPLPDKWFTAPELTVLAQPLAMVKLDYPDEFAGSTIITRVRVRLFVDERGTVQKIELVESGVDPAFGAAAIKQWQGVRFKPGIRDGVAVKSQKLLELEFLPF